MHDGHHHHDHDGNAHGGVSSMEEAIALLKYMANHNKHHTEELEEIHDFLEGEAHDLLHDAIDAYAEANEILDEVIEALEEI